MIEAKERLHVEVEKAKEVMRAAANLYRSSGSNSGSSKAKAVAAVEEAKMIARLSFSEVDSMLYDAIE